MARRTAAQSFGQLAVEAGILTETKLMECLKIHEAAEREGRGVQTVEALVKQKGFMTDEQIRLVKKAAERIKKDDARSQPIRIGGNESTSPILSKP